MTVKVFDVRSLPPTANVSEMAGALQPTLTDLRLAMQGKLPVQKLGIGGPVSSTSNSFEVDFGTPAGTGPGIVRIMGGGPSSQVPSILEGLIVQLYPGIWSDPGVAHSAINARLGVPVGANFNPWAVAATVTTAVSGGTAEHAAYWGRAEGSAGAPLWATALELSDQVSGVGSTATNLVNEARFFHNVSGGTQIGWDLIADGTQVSTYGLRVRSQAAIPINPATQGNWGTGLRIEVPAVPLVFRENDQTLPVGLWRWVADAGNVRFDQNTHATIEFSTFLTPIIVTSGQDIYFNSDDAIGTNAAGRFTRTIADTQTGLLVRRNVGGTLTMQQVTMGAVDSGGTGFKVLRVPN